MIDRIKNHIKEREIINRELTKIMGYCNNSPISLGYVSNEWKINYNKELIVYVDDDEYYYYTISSTGNLGVKQYMGEFENYTYVMVYSESWDDTSIFVLDNNLKLT